LKEVRLSASSETITAMAILGFDIRRFIFLFLLGLPGAYGQRPKRQNGSPLSV
jgi:hypothetical protein